MALSFTGERFMTECQGEMVYEHWHRYLLAREYAAGKRVLDVASGEGYGSHLIAQVAHCVVGVDLSSQAVAHATAKYEQSNLRYVNASCTDIPLPDASFDFIVSFETIEHIDEQAQAAFLREVNRLLKSDGVFLISSPNRPEYSDKSGYKNEFHVKELDQEELRVQLSQYWPYSFWAGQRAAFHSMIWPIDTFPKENKALDVEGVSLFPEAMYFLVFCAKHREALASITPSLTLVADKENSVLAEWSRTYRENRQSRERIVELEQQVIALQNAQSAPARTADAHEPWLVRAARKMAG